MKRVMKHVCTALAFLYAGLIVVWFVLHRCFGDTRWWLALLNSFVPYLFLPLVVLLPACLMCRRRAFWASVALPSLIFVALYGPLFLPARPVVFAADEAPLTVMSFNIWGGSRAPETARVILDRGVPDIVAIQELTPQMAEALLKEVGDAYPYRILDPGEGYRGMGVFSRYPLTGLSASHLSDPGWRIQVMRVETASGPLDLYNVHPLATNIMVTLQEGDSVAEQVRGSFRTRLALMQRLVADFANRPGPIVLTGDFNSTDQSDVYAILSDHLTDAHRAVGWGFGHTFPAYAGSYRGIPIVPRQMRIDMIFASDRLVPLHSRVGSTWGESDHLPVMAEFSRQQ